MKKRKINFFQKKYEEINSESLSDYESITEGEEGIVEEVKVEENENEINTNKPKEKGPNKIQVQIWDEKQNKNQLKKNEESDFDSNA